MIAGQVIDLESENKRYFRYFGPYADQNRSTYQSTGDIVNGVCAPIGFR